MSDSGTEEIKKSDLVIAIGYNFGDRSFINKLKNIDLSGKELVLIGTQDNANKIDEYPAFQQAKQFWDTSNLRVFHGDGFKDFVEAII